jgi:hypothetical protein
MLDPSDSNPTRNSGSFSCEMFSAKESSKASQIAGTVNRIAKTRTKQTTIFWNSLIFEYFKVIKLERTENWLFTICVADMHFFKILLLIGIWASSCVHPTLTLTVSEAIQQKVLRRALTQE